MATKPATIPAVWASNALYTTGPFIGSPSKVVPAAATAAEGHRPGALFPTPAEYENEQQNQITTWIVDWVYLGSSAGAADAHIVETDSTGRATLHGLDVNDTVDETAVNITGVNTVAPTIVATCTTGATVMQVDVGASAGTGLSAVLGVGAGIGLDVNMTATGLGGVGVNVRADAASTADGILVTQLGNGYGIDVAGGPGSQAVRVIAGANQIAGDFSTTTGVAAVSTNGGTTASVWGIASGTAYALRGDGSATSTAAILGTTSNTSGYGVHGRTAPLGGASAAGVFAEGRGTAAIGCYARSDAGIGLIAQGDLTSPGYPAARLVPQDDDPSAYTSDGALYWRSGWQMMRHCVAVYGYKSFLSMGPGSAVYSEAVNNAVVSDNAATYTTAVTCSLLDSEGNGYYGLASGASLRITVELEARCNVAATAILDVRIYDNTNLATIIERQGGVGTALGDGYRLTDATNEWQRSVTLSTLYTPPAEGDLVVIVEVRKGGGGAATGIHVRDIRLAISGTFG